MASQKSSNMITLTRAEEGPNSSSNDQENVTRSLQPTVTDEAESDANSGADNNTGSEADNSADDKADNEQNSYDSPSHIPVINNSTMYPVHWYVENERYAQIRALQQDISHLHQIVEGHLRQMYFLLRMIGGLFDALQREVSRGGVLSEELAMELDQLTDVSAYDDWEYLWEGEESGGEGSIVGVEGLAEFDESLYESG